MTKRCYRYFGGLLTAQENWLNAMAAQGWRLARTGKAAYDFVPCEPGQYQYRVEFVGERSRADAEDYKAFLEDLGYTVHFKNINLNWSVGKVRWRPWAEPGGQLATRRTTFDRELLLVEKEADGRPFQLHTSHEDQAGYYRQIQKPWLSVALLGLLLGVACQVPGLAVVGLLALVPVGAYQVQIARHKKAARTEE